MRKRIVIVGGGMIGTACADVLQAGGDADVTLIDDSFYPGLAETRRALGLLRRRLDHPQLASWSEQSWRYAVRQHDEPRSPVRLTFFPYDGQADAAASLDHLLLLDAQLLWFRRNGGRLKPQTTVTELAFERGRVAGVVCADGSAFTADAVVLAPGPRADTLALPGVPESLRERLQPVQSLTVPFVFDENDRQAGAAFTAPAVFRQGEYLVCNGLVENGVLVSAVVAGWEEPSFDDLVDLVVAMQTTLNLPGEAQIDRLRISRDYRGPQGLPLVGAVDALTGEPVAGLFVATAFGLNGLSLFRGAAVALQAALTREFDRAR